MSRIGKSMEIERLLVVRGWGITEKGGVVMLMGMVFLLGVMKIF